MINHLRAEFLKARKNLAVSILTIGALPIFTFVLLNMLAILGALNLWDAGIEAVNWQEQIILALVFANQLIAMALYIIFAAVCFGAEFTWNTYKNIVPRTQRAQIMLGKLLLVAIAIVASTQAMAISTGIGSWEVALFTGVPLVSGNWNSTDSLFLQQYLWISIAIFCNFMMGALYASNTTIVTQSTTAGVVFGVLIAFGDSVSQPALQIVASILRIDLIAIIPQFLPNYNIQNMMSWVTTGATLPGSTLLGSLLILLIWIVIGFVSAIVLFQRRDIG